MKNRLRAISVLLLAFLLGCASIEPPVKTSSPAESDAAYIAGKFTRTKSGGFAFVLVNAASGTEYAMSLGEDTAFPTDVTEQVTVIKVPPGRYTISQWFTYGTLTKERSSKFPVNNYALAMPFDAKAGSVVYLGNYSAYTTGQRMGAGTRLTWTVQPLPTSTAEAREALRDGYPLLGNLEFLCHVCRQ